MRRDRRAACLGLAAASTLLALLTAPPGARAQGGVAATITVLEGQAEVIAPAATAPVPAQTDMRVVPGSTVRTKANGRLELLFDDRSILRLDHNTEVRILAAPQERGVVVTLGSIWAKVQSVFGASKFKIKTPTVVAGVRGTIVRAEVSEEEAAIAVDEGEVEVTAGEGAPPTVVRQNEEVRARRGAKGLKPRAFDPQARACWEFWTDPLVRQEIQAIQEAAASHKQACSDVEQKASNIHEALAVDSKAVWRISERAKAAGALVSSVQAALAPPPPPRPGALRRVPTKAELVARLDAADRAYAECLPLVERGQATMQQHVADLRGLREALAAQQQTQQELVRRLKAFRDRREVDPHWEAFRGYCDQCDAHRNGAAKMLGQASPLLAPDVPANLGNDPLKLRSIQQRFAWGAKALTVLQKQATDGQALIAQLRDRVAALPEGQPQPRPRAPLLDAPLRPERREGAG